MSTEEGRHEAETTKYQTSETSKRLIHRRKKRREGWDVHAKKKAAARRYGATTE